MGTINKLNKIKQSKQAIKAALIAKGQNVGNKMSEYAGAIANISGGGSSENEKGLIERTISGSYTIPSGTTRLGRSCFSNCTGLTSITIPNSVTSLDISCFGGCTGLKSVVWNSNSYFIPNNTFYNCTQLEILDFSSIDYVLLFGNEDNPTAGTSNHIHIHDGLKIIVPKSLFEDWKISDFWTKFKDYIYYRDDDGTLKNSIN